MSNKQNIKRATRIHCAHELVFNLSTSEGLPTDEKQLRICQDEIIAIANRIYPDWHKYRAFSFEQTLKEVTKKAEEKRS